MQSLPPQFLRPYPGTFWRTGSKKGGYARLMTKQEALLHKLSLRDDSESFDFEEGLSEESPKKSPFSGLILSRLRRGIEGLKGTKLGWVVGPCLDLDSSVHYDLSSFELFRWVCHLLESGRLDGFMVQPALHYLLTCSASCPSVVLSHQRV